MQEEQLKILKMVEEGTITADEAQALFKALESGIETVEDRPIIEPVPSPAEPPDFEYFRNFWVIPFSISVVVLVITVPLFGYLLTGGTGRLILNLLCVAPILFVALLATLVSAWSKYSPWVHVRVQEANGRRVAISVPAPLRLVKWGLNFAAQHTAKEEQYEKISTVRELLNEMDASSDPLIVNVDDEDTRVQVYIG